MNTRQRNFLLLVTLAATVATLDFGQTATPAATIPDFSGIWAHGSIPGFEPLSSGATALVNRSRRDGVGDILQLVGDYTNPILKPDAAAVVKKFGEMSLVNVGFPSPRNQCWPNGVPFVFTGGAIELLQQPDMVTILYNYDHQLRRVRMNQTHPAQVTPGWFGDSVGHYEGDTLVIDTVGIRIGPFAAVDWFGTPYTPALHVVERYRLIDEAVAKDGWERDGKENFRVQQPHPDGRNGKYLQLEFTVEDAGVFTRPWTATMTYGQGGGDWVEAVCAENTFWFPGHEAQVPKADKPDF
jgi:hypothetical protein